MFRFSCIRALAGVAVLLTFATASAQQWTGQKVFVPSSGGTFTTERCALTVPSGAVAATTRVSFLPPIYAPITPRMIPDSGVTIGPPMSLAQPCTLTLGYDPGLIPSGTTESQLKVFMMQGDRWVEVTGSTLNTANHTVSASISRTGLFAILAATGNQPAENRIYYYAQEPLGDPLVHRLLPDGTQKDVVGSVPGKYLTMRLSPARNAIFYVQLQPNGRYDGYRADVDLSNPVKITKGQITGYSGFDVAPDGLTSYVGAQIGGVWGVYRVNQNLTLTKILSGASSAGPRLTQSGSRMVIADGKQIRVCGVNGSALSTFNAESDVSFVTISPDATKVMYYDGILRVATAAGGLLYNVDTNIESAEFNPTGTAIAYTYQSGGQLVLHVLDQTAGPLDIATLGPWQEGPYNEVQILWK